MSNHVQGPWQEVFGADGTWVYARETTYEDYRKVKHHDVEVVKVLDWREYTPEPAPRDGVYYMQAMEWDLLALSRDEIIKVCRSTGYGDWTETPDDSVLSPDDKQYFADRMHALRWDAQFAARNGVDVERLADDHRALCMWYKASPILRGEMLMDYYGGDEPSYRSAYSATLQEALSYYDIPRDAVSDVKDWDDDPALKEGWGPECTLGLCSEPIYPRERHARHVAKQAQEAHMRGETDDAERLITHLARVIALIREDGDDTPDWYVGDFIYASEYATLAD